MTLLHLLKQICLILLVFFTGHSFAQTPIMSSFLTFSPPVHKNQSAFYKRSFYYVHFDRHPLKYLKDCSFVGSQFSFSVSTPFLHSASEDNSFLSCSFYNLRSKKMFFNKINLHQSYFENTIFSSIMFSELSLKVPEFKNVQFNSCVFYRSTFTFCDFSSALLKQPIFLDCTLDQQSLVTLRNSHAIIGFKGLENAAKKETTLQNHRFRSISFLRLHLSTMKWQDADFNECYFENVFLRSASFNRTSFFFTDFININAYSSHINETTFSNVLIENSDFSSVTFNKSVFSNTTFRNVRFNNSIWDSVLLENCTFINCSFDGTSQTNVTLKNTPSFPKIASPTK